MDGPSFPGMAFPPRDPIADERFAFPGKPVTQGTTHRPVDVRVLPRLVINKACASLGHLTKEGIRMEIVVGWDWADGHHDVMVQDCVGHTLWAGQVAHTREALEALEARLLQWSQQHRADVHVVIETSQGLVVDWLSTTGFWVYPVNPKVSDARRKPSGAKTDRLDTAILARLGWHERDQLRPLRPAAEDWTELRQLTRIDEDLTQQTVFATGAIGILAEGSNIIDGPRSAALAVTPNGGQSWAFTGDRFVGETQLPPTSALPLLPGSWATTVLDPIVIPRTQNFIVAVLMQKPLPSKTAPLKTWWRLDSPSHTLQTRVSQ